MAPGPVREKQTAMKQNYIAPQTEVIVFFTHTLIAASSLTLMDSQAATEGDDGVVLSRQHDYFWKCEEEDE